MLTLITGDKKMEISREGLISLAMTFPILSISPQEIVFRDSVGRPFYVASPPLGQVDLEQVLTGLYQA